MASVSGGRGPNATSFAVKSYAAAPSNPPVCEAGDAASEGSTCCAVGSAGMVAAPVEAAAGDAAEFAVEFPAAETDFGAASCPQAKSETTAAIASQAPHFPSRK